MRQYKSRKRKGGKQIKVGEKQINNKGEDKRMNSACLNRKEAVPLSDKCMK
jgi:hypothetical protein